MPRLPRPTTPGIPHHIISRFVNREFRLGDDAARQAYQDYLRRAWKKFATTRLSAFGLMSSHVHLVASSDSHLGPFLHSANTGFGAWYNRRHGGLGRVFAHRPRSEPVGSEGGLARCVAYCHNNPGRAELVQCPSESTWTTHRAFIGLDPAPPFVDVEWTLAAMGFSASNSGRASFHDFVCSRAHLPRDPSIAGPNPSSPEEFHWILQAAVELWELDIASLRKPVGDLFYRDLRRQLITVAIEVFGVRQAHIATTLGVSKPVVSRLAGHASMPDASVAALTEAYLKLRSQNECARSTG